MTYLKKTLLLVGLCVLNCGCGTYFNQPIGPEDSKIGELTNKSNILKNFPLPNEKVVVGVYNFKDQTGQYKSVENGSTFSTAVSQGATTILVKALEDSKWFTPIERENLGNLLNERNIIRSTREEYRKNPNSNNQPNLPPLLYAGMLLEGGVISYDSNIVTGGVGARYFGVGGSTEYRQDRITVYLRAVATSSGEVLKTVYVSKTILSQAVDASLFRYVNFQRLLEVETGFTKNEPVQLAMQDAIEKAVEALIIEGIDDKLWSTKDGEQTNKDLVEEYNKEKEIEESTLLYNRKQTPRILKNALTLSGSVPLLNGDFSKKRFGSAGGLAYSRNITDNFDLSLEGQYLTLKGGNTYSKNFIDASLRGQLYILPYEKFTPYVYAGVGYLFDLDKRFNQIQKVNPVLKFQTGVGLKYLFSERIGIKFYAENNFTFSDELDLAVTGKRDDFFYNFGLGLIYNFGRILSADVKEIPNKL